MKTVKVRIAVAVCSNGQWAASGPQCFAHDFLYCDWFPRKFAPRER